MDALRTVDILNSIVPISRFNKGEANKIFSEVKSKGTRIVVKNNVPECVLMSPEEYQKMYDEYENAVLYAEAQKRAAEDAAPVPHNAVMTQFGITDADIDDADVELD